MERMSQVERMYRVMGYLDWQDLVRDLYKDNLQAFDVFMAKYRSM